MVKPVIHPPRKIALSLQPKLEGELDEMVKQVIVVPVDEPPDWVNTLVVREKHNGSLRICLDPKDLNKAIKREHTTLSQLLIWSLIGCRVQHFFTFRWQVSILECRTG